VHSNSGVLALRALVKEASTGIPVSRALLIFKPLEKVDANPEKKNIIKKRSATRGGLRIKNMKAGQYNVTVTKPGFKPKEIIINIISGERTELVVEMERV